MLSIIQLISILLTPVAHADDFRVWNCWQQIKEESFIQIKTELNDGQSVEDPNASLKSAKVFLSKQEDGSDVIRNVTDFLGRDITYDTSRSENGLTDQIIARNYNEYKLKLTISNMSAVSNSAIAAKGIMTLAKGWNYLFKNVPVNCVAAARLP